jgi:chemotaxis protein CheD
LKNKLELSRCVIGPGHVVFSAGPAYLCSVCGCGVIVTVWDKIKRSGGMVHCIFPRRRFREKMTNYHTDVAIPVLLREFSRSNSQFSNLEAQIFGGGNVRGFAQKRAAATVKTARKILARSRVAVVSEDSGGSVGRKIVFNTFSGDAMVWKTRSVRATDWAPEYCIHNDPEKAVLE